MSNTKTIAITGTIPYCCYDHNDIRNWLGIMNAPTFGLQIDYPGDHTFVPTLNGKGKIAMYDFVLHGTEALSTAGITALMEALLRTGEAASPVHP
jgi:hypothetical protein